MKLCIISVGTVEVVVKQKNVTRSKKYVMYMWKEYIYDFKSCILHNICVIPCRLSKLPLLEHEYFIFLRGKQQ